MKKRKVIYQVWIPRQVTEINLGPIIKSGTNCFSEPSSGYFHSWGMETIELAEDVVSNTIAIVEDCVTGYVHKVDPIKMRFVLPDEFEGCRKLPSVKASQKLSQSFDLLELGAALLDQIEIISKKLDTL